MARLLESHHNIHVSDELFNVSTLSNRIDWITHPKSKVRHFFDFAPATCHAKGFKLMYNHLSCREFEAANWPHYIPDRIKGDIQRINQTAKLPMAQIQKRFDETLEWLLGQKTFRVIHLKRRNMLDTLVSTKLAFMEDNWTIKPYELDSIQLSVSECEDFFSETTAQQQYYANLFSGHPIFDLYYEDLIVNFGNVVSELQDFLLVPVHSFLNSTMKKQGKRDKRSLISNFASLEEHFSHTTWSAFFNSP